MRLMTALLGDFAMTETEHSADMMETATVGATSLAESAPSVRQSVSDYQPTSAHAAEEIVRFAEVAARVGGRTIWHDVSFTAQAGEFIAVLGPNGAGKSTLLKVALGLLPVAEGRVGVLGRTARRGAVGVSYLPQRRVFDADTRIRTRDLVWLGLEGTRWGTPLPGLRALWGGDRRAREVQRRVQEALDLVGASAYADRPIGEISGGEQQRALIAQALVTRPKLLLLDEPLDGLDLPNQQAVAHVIQVACRQAGVAVLLVAHDVNPILPYLDRVLYLARGQAVIGEPEHVITTETLSRLYGAHVEVLRTSDGRLIVVGQPEEEISYHAHAARSH
jgi:zinc/manganese transport system ATP-binding protein